MIYVDEFHLSMKNSSLYNWSLKGHPSMLWVNASSWIMSFIVALSEKQIEFIIASNKSITHQIFCWFLSDILKRLQHGGWDTSQVCFIFDNASLHSSSNSIKYMKEQGIKSITIPPYSPQLNPAEKLIEAIKIKVRKDWIENKSLSLKWIHKIVDELDRETWRKWILSSRIETINRLQTFQNQSNHI